MPKNLDNSLNTHEHAGGSNILSADYFDNLVMSGMHEFSKTEPTLTCLIPVVDKFIKTDKMWKDNTELMIKHTNKFFNEWILGEGNQVWVFVFDGAINTLGSLLFLG